jgi:hypothetical protein
MRVLFGCGYVGLIGIWDDDMEPGAKYLNSGWMMPTFVMVLILISIFLSEILLILVVVDFLSNMRALRQYRKAGKLS